MNEVILFIDDERFKQKAYVEALQEDGFEVHFETSAELGVELLSNHHADYCCAVIDVMMFPPPKEWEDLTVGGQFTGIELIARVGVTIIELPILLLSNKATGDVKARLSKELANIRDELVVDFRHKIETRSDELPLIVRSLIRKHQRRRNPPSATGA